MEQQLISLPETLKVDFSTSTVVMNNTQFSEVTSALTQIASALNKTPAFWETQVFAVFVGGFLGLLPFLYLLYKERPIIKLELSRIFVPDVYGDLKDGFAVTISNHGQKSIVLSRFYLRFPDGESLVFIGGNGLVGGTDGLPLKLEGGNSHSIMVLATSTAEFCKTKGQFPVAAYIASALGKTFKIRTSNDFWEGLFISAGLYKKNESQNTPS